MQQSPHAHPMPMYSKHALRWLLSVLVAIPAFVPTLRRLALAHSVLWIVAILTLSVLAGSQVAARRMPELVETDYLPRTQRLCIQAMLLFYLALLPALPLRPLFALVILLSWGISFARTALETRDNAFIAAVRAFSYVCIV